MPKLDHELIFSVHRPHPGQLVVLNSLAKTKVTVLSPGRQWGKSSIRPFAIVDQGSRHAGWIKGAYVGPSHGDAINAYEADLFDFGRVGLVKDSGGSDQDRHIDFYPINRGPPRWHPAWCVCSECEECRIIHKSLNGHKNEGVRVYYVTGHPDAHAQFQKHRLHFAIIDEFSHVAHDAWAQTIRPMFNTTGGHALIVGTPIQEGINFSGFGEMFNMGVEGSDTYKPRYKSITGSSFDNPFANVEEIQEQIDDLRKVGREAAIRCWYYGEFVTEIGAVFTNLDNVFCLDGREVERDTWILRDPTPYESVVISIDFGKHDDSTVVHAFCVETLEHLGCLRIQNTEYLHQLPLIDRFVRRYHVRQIWSEGREEGAAELLRRMFGPATNLVKWTSGGKFDKSACVTRGMDMCERTAWKFMKIPWMRAEFTNFERKKLPSGGWAYSAPKGKHDDSVASALYATYGLPLVPTVAAKVAENGSEFQRTIAHLFTRKSLMDQTAELPYVLRR